MNTFRNDFHRNSLSTQERAADLGTRAENLLDCKFMFPSNIREGAM